MSQFPLILGLALLPVAGALLGAIFAELVRTPKWLVGAALHAAAGVATALVSVELMPRVLDTTPVWLIGLLFAAGGAVSVLMAMTVRAVQGSGERGRAGMWKVYAANGADLFSDGLMVGATSAVSGGLGLLLALSQVVANFPGGFATVANLRSQQVERRERIWAAVLLALPALVGAVLGYLVLRGAATQIQDATLALIAGILLVTTIEDLVPQADRPGTARIISTAAFVAGFVFFSFLSQSVG